jgi:tetratricopeptide (TPR) repeat protein
MQVKLLRFLILLLVLSICPVYETSALATTMHGVAVDALDGETINVNVANLIVKVGLCAVTAPRKGQNLAEVSRSHLALLTKGKQVSIDYNILARDGIIVGIVTVGGMDVGMQMIRDGAALYNRKSQADVPPESRWLYEQSEQAARSEARGVWENHPDLSLEKLETESLGSTVPGESESQRAKRLSNEAHEMILHDNYQAAMARLREAIRLAPNLGDAHKNLALLFCDTNRYQDALPEAREAIRLSPEFDKAHNVMGVTLYGLGDLEGSIKEYYRAIAINPRYGVAYFNLAVSYDHMKQFKKALATYPQAEKFVDTPSNRANTQLNIGWVLNELGRRAEARQRWQKVLIMGDPVAAARAEQNLQYYR